MVGFSNDNAVIVCPVPFAPGTPLKIALSGYSAPEMNVRVARNEGDSGRGYRLQLQLTDGSWPYTLFTQLTSQAMADKPGQVTPAPACLQELGLTPPCTVQDVERAFHLRVRTAHPDRGGSVEGFVRLRAAYLEALELLGAKR